MREHYIVENKGYDFKPNYNTAPTQKMPVVTKTEKSLKIEDMKWGIHRHIGPTIEKDIINTRADKAFSRFWSKYVHQFRCLIPASGFYEWKITDGSKTPYFIRPKNMELFSFAGIYSEDSDGNKSYSIMTTTPNNEMQNIHNRMPVILNPDLETVWLNTKDEQLIMDTLQPYPDNGLEMYVVSKDVNSPRNNFPGLLKKTEV